MKALRFINLLLENAEGMGTVEFREEEDRMDFCEMFFGVRPDCDIPAGKYVYVYSDMYDIPDFYAKLQSDSAAVCLPVAGDCDVWLIPME